MSVCVRGMLDLDAQKFRECFDREPMGFSHSLSELDIFKLESLHRLAEKMNDQRNDVMIAASAATPDTRFFSVPMVPYNASQAIENLDSGTHRILLKRAENHDPKFKELIHSLFEEVMQALGGLGGQKVLRLESGILITSRATITPFHYDPEIGCFSQIEGEKMYHVYSPAVVRETELEKSCSAGPVSLAPLTLDGRDPAREQVFRLSAGKGFHQPQHAPHWVETGNSRSISYTFVFETDVTRALGRTRAFNYYLRKLGLKPASVGSNAAVDGFKADTMRAALPVRGQVARLVRKIRYR